MALHGKCLETPDLNSWFHIIGLFRVSFSLTRVLIDRRAVQSLVGGFALSIPSALFFRCNSNVTAMRHCRRNFAVRGRHEWSCVDPFLSHPEYC